MQRKLALALGVAAVVAVAVWFFGFRGKGDAPALAAPATEQAKGPAKDPWLEAHPASDREPAAPRGAAPKWSLDLDPEGPLRLEGQVVDGDGTPLGGAEVTLGSVPPRTAKTEGDGSFAFDKLVGRTYEIAATSGDLIGGPVSYKLMQGSDPVVVRLAAGAMIDATINDEKGQPIANATVAIPEPARREGKTDDKGHAIVKGVKPGWVSVEASAPGYAPSGTYSSVGSAGATGKVALVLKKGASVSGRVIDETGKPIAKARVTAGGANMWSHSLGEQTTDDKGQFQFPALAPGSHTFAVIDGEHSPTESTPVTVKAEKPVSGVEIVMKAGAVLAGTVVDADGKPRAFATVRVSSKGGDEWRATARQATTDSKGAFELRGLARAKMQARAESETAASKVTDVDLKTQANVKGLRLVLDVSGTISGKVVDETGAAVAEVQVNAFPDLLAGAPTEGLALAGMSSATTDGEGAFTIHGLPDGSYRLWAARHSSTVEEGWGKQSTPAKVGDHGVKITLSAPGGLTGKLVLETGNAPKVGYVQVGQNPATPIGTNGTFKVDDLAPGPYDLHAYGPEFSELAKHDITVEPGKTTDLGSLTVVRGRKLVGKVVDQAGSPVPGAKVKLAEMLVSGAQPDDPSDSFDDVSGIRSGESDQDGTFAISGVPQKATNVMADEPDHGRSIASPVPAGTDDPPPVTLVLHGYGSVIGKVTMKGEPQAKVAVTETTKGGGAQAQFAQTAADGTFEMPKVPEGMHVLSAMVPAGMMSMKSASATVQVTAGKQSTVTIDVPVGTISLTTSFKPMAGQTVNAAQVFLLSGNVSVSNAKQLLDGFFQGGMQGMKFWFNNGSPPPEFDEIVAGMYSVCAVPVTGDLSNSQFQQRLQENMQTLKVVCKLVNITPTPTAQTFTEDLPAMTPLPTPKT